MGRITFITGGAKSGKSSFALKLACESHGKKAFIATAQAMDNEMRTRINRHRRQRDKSWQTFEAPIGLADTLTGINSVFDAIVIDCITLWACNLLENRMDIRKGTSSLIKSLKASKADIYIVSNEVGMGIVPENPYARRFRDIIGDVNKRLANMADEAYFMASGMPIKLK